MVKIYYRERLQPEVTQEKQYIEHSLRKYPIQSSHCSLSSQDTLSFQNWCVTISADFWQLGKFIRTLMFRVVIEIPLHRHDCVSTWLILVYSASRCDPKPPPGITLFLFGWPKAPGKQRHFCQAWHFRSLEVTSQKLKQRPDLLWGKVKLFTMYSSFSVFTLFLLKYILK